MIVRRYLKKVDFRGKFKTLIVIKKFKKIVFRLLLALFCLLILAVGSMMLPIVQSYLARYVTEKVNEKFGTDFYIDRLSIDVFGVIHLKGVEARDNHENILIGIDHLQTRLADLNALQQGKVYLGTTRINGLYMNIHKYEGAELTNLDELIAVFDDGQPGEGKFRLKASRIFIKNSQLIISDDNTKVKVAVDFRKLQGQVDNFLIKGPEIYGTVKNVSFLDHWGMNVQNLTADFSHTKTSIGLKDMKLVTDQSDIEGNLKLTFEPGDMKYFVDKVKWDFEIKKAKLNSSDINVFAHEFASNKEVFFKGYMKGVMNDFVLEGANLVDENNSQIIGKFAFRNVFDDHEPFWMRADLSRLQTTRYNLVALMPDLLGKSLPTELDGLGLVNIIGNIELTKRTLDTDIEFVTAIGKGNAKIAIQQLNDPDHATYKGNIKLDHFDLGHFIQNEQFGLTSFDLYVDGHGFNQKSLNTSVKGDVFSFVFSKYKYTQLAVDGLMKMPYYRGLLHSADPNVKLDFNGTIDLSTKEKNYDFVAQIDYADLYALGFVNDTLSKFTGDFEFKAKGNNIEDLEGVFKVNNAIYDNSKDHYVFEEFSIESSFTEGGERLLKLNSKEAIQGYIKGKFLFGESKMLFTNALGSLYTNYSPYKTKKGQYVDFDITVHNRLIEVFLPQLTLNERTHVDGEIDSDENLFKLNFDSPSIAVSGVEFFNILLNVNNSNPIYNTYVSIDSVHTNFYDISDFNLLNLTHNDTLFVRSEFKGGKNLKDKYELNLYHTINEEKLSVVGFKKSEVFFKDFQWSINENNDKANKLVFNKKLMDFTIDSLAISHNKQMVNLSGVMRDSTYKKLNLSFGNVDLNKITPDIENLSFGGKIDGEVNFSQMKDVYHPQANIVIDSLLINKIYLGDMFFKVDGDKRLEKFTVQSSLMDDEEKERFYLNGDVDVINKQTHFNLESGLTDFPLATIAPFLSSVASDMTGTAFGKISFLGTAKNPDVNGRLYLNDTKFKSKFTGVSYAFDQETPLDITTKQFILRKAGLTDTKYKTRGLVDGNVSHKMFKDWVMNLSLSSTNLLALDTQYTEGSLYYGTAYINGKADIVGPIEMLSININATSNKGTSIKIPLKEAQSTGENNFIHFLSPQEKKLRLTGNDYDPYKYRNSGIELDFEFYVTPDAEIEIILDRESGHAMRGKGAGFITMEINTLGKFNMWGDFQAYEGEYNFKYGGLIDKKFVVKKYGTIRWDGNPMNAILDLQAIYHTEANPSVIIDNSIINRKVPTDVAIVLNGSLSNPEVDFDINFPTVSSVVKSELDYKLSDRDTRERQAMALLATGSFFSSDNSSSALAGSLFERASSIFDDLFSDVDDKFKVGLNYAQGERNPYTQTEGRLGVTFTTKVNDRISVNGKLGVPVGGVEQSVIVGDVEVLLRINEEGTLNARFFNRENDINYIGEGIGYTQGVGLSYEVDFDTLKELIAKFLNQSEKKKKKKEEKESSNNRAEDLPDSDYSQEFIRFYETRRKSGNTPSGQ